MNTDTLAKFASLVKTRLVYARPRSAAVTITIGSRSHRVELAVIDGGFGAGIVDACGIAVDVWLPGVFVGCTREEGVEAARAIATIIRVRHEKHLLKPDPRRLPLTLPPLAPSKGRARMAAGVLCPR